MTCAVERVKGFLVRVDAKQPVTDVAMVNFQAGGWEMVRLDDLRDLVSAYDAAKYIPEGRHLIGQAIRDVIAERNRQVADEGFDTAHDDANTRHELARAAACYAAKAAFPNVGEASFIDIFMRVWPWDERWWKPAGHRQNLVKAGALILAEIERLDRVETKEARP
ncbi:hypothetical protein [uncultured Thalassospira sp.]|uniref:hypothetical protein n=1 Tax=uncultured Thalassospira sp. TaxID=404382 RepID=UPI0030D8260C|tara:strand:+ start:12525 stop:13019 length:495 start_codon:yes stop_codon:yes gene_type:complete